MPFLDLALSHRGLRDAIAADVAELIDSNAFVNGPAVGELERAFAAYSGTADCVGMASGLDALRLGLLACGISRGDEVIVPANTFIATVEAVVQAGGVPVLVDAGEEDYNIDPDAVEGAFTRRTRFVLPVHLYGQLADMRALTELASRNDLVLVEDACQAHGAVRDGLRAGAVGAFGAFSFYPGKNLGAMGDAGALTTSSAAVAERSRALREHGQRRKYHHDELGYTSRLDTLQALVLLRKLPLLDRWNDERRRAAQLYTSLLEEVGDVRTPPTPSGSEPVWHLYTLRTAHAEVLSAHLRECGIATGRHYPVPLHLTDALASLGHGRGSFPVAEALAEELVSLPMFPGITDEQVERVTRAVAGFFSG